MTDEASPGGDGPRLHIDSDWKAQAQAEKERLAEREAARGASERGREAGGEAGGELPPADFRTLVATLASQAMMGLGAYGDPQTGRVVIDVVGAQFAIDVRAEPGNLPFPFPGDAVLVAWERRGIARNWPYHGLRRSNGMAFSLAAANLSRP